MENTQKTQNFFFEKITKNFKKSTPEKISNDLKIIINKNCKNLSIAEFELLGSLAYLTGIDFSSQTTGLNPSTLRNVTDRYIAQGLTSAIWSKFLAIIKIISLDDLIGPKELIKNEVSLEIPTSKKLVELKFKINNILKNSYIPVKFAANTDLLIKTKKITYIQLLNFNSMVYEQMKLKGSSINSVVELFKLDELKTLLNEATEKFDNQKYAIIYFDSIITLAEFNSAKEINANVLFNDTLIKELSEIVEENSPTMEVVKDEVDAVPEAPVTTYEYNETDFFLKASLEESLERKIENIDDLHEAFLTVSKNEELMQHIYRYIRANVNNNRTKFEDVYNFDLSAVEDFYSIYLKTNVDKYNDLFLRYVAELPKNSYVAIVDAVNNVIKSLIIDNNDHKGYLIQQIFENQIETYKQLHQTINIIEDCSIIGEKINTYVALRDLIIYNDEITNIFDESLEIENIKLDLQFFTAVKAFFCHEKENDLEAEKSENLQNPE